MRVAVCCLLFSLYASGQSDPWKNVYTQSAWKNRDAWQKPDELIRKMNIKAGSNVADIGCHEGYMSFKLSSAVGPTGKVFAVDVEESKLDRLRTHIDASHVTNITTVKGDDDDPKLPPGSLDAVIILDTYHEMDDHDKILERIKDALKPGGRLILCEPVADSRRSVPRKDQKKRHELGMNYAIEDLERVGFRILEKTDPFADREKIKGDKMWLIVATPK